MYSGCYNSEYISSQQGAFLEGTEKVPPFEEATLIIH